ncbi:MAG: dephospho-CoA kinase [Gammaproteobacteria bacterium]|jgi:dephospho-CoA kinase
MLTVGLTGGIGSGKSEVAKIFEHLGVPVIDADRISHQLVQRGGEALAEIVSVFGETILTAEGHLDRTRLADIVFNNPAKKKLLEHIIHPRVGEQIRRCKEKHNSASYILVVIPLLIESGQYDLVDRILVVNAAESVRIQRVQARDGRSEDQIRAILHSQADNRARQAAADDELDNSGTLADLPPLVEKLHHQYLSIARVRNKS